MVAWFSASRVFNTDVANFSVVEIDGNLDVTMEAGQGTIKTGEGKIAVIDSTNKPSKEGDFKKGATDAKPATPITDDLYYDETLTKMLKYDGGDWVDFGLTEGDHYANGNDWYVATDGTHIVPANSDRPVVLTHGSVDHTETNENHAFVINGNSTSEFIDKGADAPTNWCHIKNVTIKDSADNDAQVDVYNAVSWQMTFTYTFASDSTPVAVYLDLNDSTFVDPEITPHFKKNLSDPRKTSKGFRISFSGTGHDVVWGNESPTTTDIPAAYDRALGYTSGVSKVVHDGKIYVCNTTIAANAEDWTPAHWTLTQDVSLHDEFVATTSYEVGDIVIHEGKAYKCKTDGVNAWNVANWDLADTGDLRYVSNGGHGTSETSLYSSSDYVWHKSESRLENLDANEFETFKPGVSRSSRICVLTPGSNTVTINCAAWFEGTDPNVVSGAAMECLKANMTFYSRTVNADA